MRTKNEGKNTFSGYDTIQIYLDTATRRKDIDSIQLTFGGFAYSDIDDSKIEIARYRQYLKQFFNKKSKDGYFKDRFIFIDGFHTNYPKMGQGIIFNQIYFFLEETYEKNFVIDYFLTFFQDLNDYHKNHPFFKFSKYKHRKQDRVAAD